MGQHVHVAGVAARGKLAPCRCPDPKCIEWRVGTGDRWRELTRHEQTELTIWLWEDLIIHNVGRVMHPGDGGAWARRVLGYQPKETRT